MKLFVFAAVVAVCAAAPSQTYEAPQVRAALQPVAKILEEDSQHDGQEGFSFRFVSDDGIERQEQGSDGAVTGSYSYTSPEGAEIVVSYVADALGFRAEGAALPTAVPTEYPTPEVPSTEAAPEVRTVQGYSAPAPEVRAAPAPVQYEKVLVGYQPRYQ
ncbi:cuticle protein 3-like [Pollicipes pollicipes]|uniref:cuticle protein 3-like n=1 Tax=Pollicipes pollicipes TaxID=41117 RepID=UPI001884B6D9|nr:cuticle protein 3-like [Pollicipes pollicipes]